MSNKQAPTLAGGTKALNIEKIGLKEIISIGIAVAIVAVSLFLPETAGLSQVGVRTISLVVAFLILMVTEALPLVITCWITLAMMPVLGITEDFGKALTGFSNPVVFFILASLGIAAAYEAVPLSKRILRGLFKAFGKNVKSMLFAIMLGAAIISSIVSNVPTCALFMAITLSFLELYEDENEKKRTGRAFMIAIPVASLIGGMITPAGSSINLLAIGLLEEYTGQTITFVQWISFGLPLAVLILPMAWFLAVKVYKPVEINQDSVKNFIAKMDVPEKMDNQEKKVLIITLVMLVLWILSSWVPSINVMVVAMLGCCALFLPGIRVLEWKPFIKNVNLDAFFLVGTVLSTGGAMINNGVSDWIISLLPTVSMSFPILIAFTVLLVFALLVIIPVSPSLVMLLAAPLIALATGMGYSAPAIILTLGLAAGNCYLLPLDTVPLITYGTGYYSMTDMAKSTFMLQIYVIAVFTVVVPLINTFMNI